MRRLATTLTAAALAASAAAQTVATVLSNGSTDTRYDMVILGDGYQSHEQTQFNTDVSTFLADLFQTQPYQTFASYYNVHTVFRASVDSGADHPDASPPIYRNTVYDSTYNTGGTGRCLYIQNTSQALADAALAPATEGRVLVMVNDSRYGGCAATFAVSYNGSQMSQVQIHELGHSMGQLADEYEYANTTYTGGEPSTVNITTSPSGTKWSHWHGTSGISSTAFQGAGYFQYGLYRPRNNCLMRTLGQTLCAVCQENITRITNSVCQAIDQTQPGQNVTITTGQSQQFSFAHFVPAAHSPLIEWKLDGVVIPGENTTAYTLDTTGMALGFYTLECSVLDQTPLVRQDPLGLMRHEYAWNVTVTSPTVAQLRVPTLALNPIWVTPGSSLTINSAAINDGPATAAAFDVEFFVSTTTNWTPGDIYLGKQTITNLAATQQVAIQRTVTLPYQLPGGVYFVTAVADRTNVVPELSETDNEATAAFIAQAGPCTTKLEFDDPLLYPLDAATVSIGAGGTVHPTVVAPCATPGTLYLIVWGCSGTTPGTTIGAGTTVPINQDFHTQLGLSLTNGAMFQGFFGVIDPQGLGRATFHLPPSSGLWPSSGHFAALMIDPSPTFAGTTNPVMITITQ